MQPFSFQYKGVLSASTAMKFIEDGDIRYRVSLPPNLNFVIAPAGRPGKEGRIIWLQINKPWEILVNRELIQALGEGLESSGIYTNR